MQKYTTRNASFNQGIPSVLSDDRSGIATAVATCAAAETCVVAVGSDTSWASEGHDAENISYTGAQQALITEAAAAARKPIIVVTLTAVPLDLSFFLDNPKVGAIVHVGQPSVTVLGLAEVMWSEGGRSPSGRLIQTVYPSSFQDEISIFDFNMRPGRSKFVRPDCNQTCEQPPMYGGSCGTCAMGVNPGRTHRFYTDKAVLPFGFGLSCEFDRPCPLFDPLSRPLSAIYLHGLFDGTKGVFMMGQIQASATVWQPPHLQTSPCAESLTCWTSLPAPAESFLRTRFWTLRNRSSATG
jgi:hypothetical protein